MTAPALELAGIDKRFGPVVALARASVVVRAGTVHALLGENGAGKTTLLRIAYGLTVADRGAVLVDGSPLRPGAPGQAIRAGLALVQQHFALVPAMTVLENVALGASPRRVRREAVQRIADQAGLRLDVSARVADLGVGAQQRAELLKALAREARVLMLDEPSASLPPDEAAALFERLRSFRDAGGSVVLITHRLREALALADDITVLRRGVVTWSGQRAAADEALLLQAMLGAAAPRDRPTARSEFSGGAGTTVRATAAAIGDDRGVVRVQGLDLELARGVVVGVAGVEGSGVREFMYALAGRARVLSGHLELPASIGFIPDDRQRDALLPDSTILDNVLLRGAGRRRGWLRRRDTLARSEAVMRAGGVSAPGALTPVAALSGGNQQRLVVARELERAPDLIVAMNPWRGLDVAASADVRRRLQDAAARGATVVVHSADLDDVVAVADRVLVVAAGTVRPVERDREAIGRAMVGGA